MDLETASVVAEVSSSPSLIKLKINTTNQNFQNIPTVGTASTFNKDQILPSDYHINSTNVSSSFSNINVVDLPNIADIKKLDNSDPFCVDNEYINIGHVGLLNKNYNSGIFEHVKIGEDKNSLIGTALRYHDLLEPIESGGGDDSDPVEFISPASILQANSELVDPQDKADFTALDDYLNITDEIEPHFIVGSFGDYDKLVNTKSHQNSTVDMGIENVWNEEFAVPSTSSFPLPLPAPPESSSFGDFSTCNNFEGVEDDSYDLEALFSCSETEIDRTDAAAELGVCGLRNLGNTCFMSAGIQCLAATECLVKFFVHSVNPRQLEENLLTIQFTDLLQRMWSGQYSVVNPVQFKQALGTYHSQFKDSGQHDCQEFLALLLDALHQQLMSVSKEITGAESFRLNEKIDIGVNFQHGVNAIQNDSMNNCAVNSNNGSVSSYKKFSRNRKDINNSQSLDDNSLENRGSRTSENNDNKIDPIQQSSSSGFSSKSNLCTDVKQNTFHKNNHEYGNNISAGHEVFQSLLLDVTAVNNKDAGVGLANKTNHIADIFKEAKTSNVNVSSSRMDCLDSEKFPKKERRRNIANAIHYDSIFPDVATIDHKNSSFVVDDCNIGDNLDLKRIKVNHLHKDKNCLLDTMCYPSDKIGKNVLMELERQQKILNVDVDVKIGRDIIEMEELSYTNEGEMTRVNEDSPNVDDFDAEKQWKKHVQYNQSVVFNSFEGQFKNTIVCSACNFKSITYEPFMYLSVPLPHAIEKQLSIIFVPASPRPPVKYLLTLTKQDEVYKIKQQLLRLIPDKLTYPLVISEVLDYHIAKILDDNCQVRYVDDINRSIYAFEQFHVVSKSAYDAGAGSSANCLPGCDNQDAGINSINSETCTICLEEKESDIKKHKDCDCILCDTCIQNYAQHSGETIFKCPVCRHDISPNEDLVSIEQADMKPSTRLLNVPLVYRINKIGDGNNQKSVMFGHPALLKLPNQVFSTELYEIISSLNPYQHPFELLLVDGQGRHCSRCMFNQHCKGCMIPRNSHISLRSDDTLAVTFPEDVDQIIEIQHSSMSLQRSRKTLSLYDCVQAFSQSEILDEYNPWYCPHCKKNQCATKTLSVWRFPDYLIVYLKRFVFHECTSVKLEDKVMFPLHDFSFNENKESSYDLYACVCHTGGVSVGHYVAYTQHPLSKEWHCYNDENVSKQKPQDEEYSNAYVLFYKKKNQD